MNKFVVSGSSQRSWLHTLGHRGFVRLIEIHGRSSEIVIANASLCWDDRILDGSLHLWALLGAAKEGHWAWLGRQDESRTAHTVALQDKQGCGACLSNCSNSHKNSWKPEKAFAVYCPTESYRVPPETMQNSDGVIMLQRSSEDDLVLDIDLAVWEHLPAVYHPLHSQCQRGAWLAAVLQCCIVWYWDNPILNLRSTATHDEPCWGYHDPSNHNDAVGISREAQVQVDVAACGIFLLYMPDMWGGFWAVAGNYSHWSTPGDEGSLLNKPPSILIWDFLEILRWASKRVEKSAFRCKTGVLQHCMTLSCRIYFWSPSCFVWFTPRCPPSYFTGVRL